MPRLQAFKNELVATGAQQRQMGPSRFVFNQALALRKSTKGTKGTKRRN